MNRKLDRIEARLRTLFEDRFISIITGNKKPAGLMDDIIEVMRDSLVETEEGQILAPDRFILHVPPEEHSEWQACQDVLDALAAALFSTGQSEGFVFQKSPSIEIHPDEQVQKDDFSLSAHISRAETTLPDTAAMPQPELGDTQTHIPENASLIVGGNQGFPLEKDIVNIGRHSDNDLVLDNLQISRHHVQLRAINHRYVIFDVGSTGGTFLNGKKIAKASLQPGDVIRIGTVNLIYIQDSVTASHTTALPLDPDKKTSSGESE